MPDPRWKYRFIFPTLVLQLIFAVVVVTTSAPDSRDTFYMYYYRDAELWIPLLSLGSCSLFCTIVHVVCYWTSHLHPLVVLTLAIQWMITWLGAAIFAIIYHAQHIYPEYCGPQYDREGWWMRIESYRLDPTRVRTTCNKRTAAMIFSVLLL
jgi:hypothetical protein